MCQMKAGKMHTSKPTWVDWAELNPDLIYLISRKLCGISDFIMFRAVCKAWRDATNLSDPPPQFPCLIDWHPWVKGNNLQVYSPVSQRSHIFHVPETYIYGPVGQNVMILSYSDFFCYLNPLTRIKTSSPFQKPFNELKPDYVGFSPRIEEFLMIKYYGSDVFYFKQPGLDKRTSMFFDDLRSAAYYKNRYFLLEKSDIDYKIMVIYKYDKSKLSYIPFPNKGFDLNYVTATTDHLLAVSASIHRYDLKGPNKSQFEVQRLDNYPQNPHWTKLSGIGDVMLFLDHCSCFSLNAGNYSGFKGNCIYYITHKLSQCRTKHEIGRFDMGLKKVEVLSGPSWFDLGQDIVCPEKAAWFVPGI